jgi:RNA polymerase sigma factor (sigma-70 family)
MNAENAFQTHHPRLMALAYRLLGSRADAEDVVQDAWLRWSGADPAAIRDPEAWLVTTTTRLGLDRLRAARRERAHYVGPWLAEPLAVTLEPDPAPGPAQLHALADDVSVAFLTLLEQLGPEERAAFLLKEAFDHDYREIADLRAWLTTVTGRLCLDHLRAAKVRREAYIGPWLPSPLVERLPDPAQVDPGERVSFRDSVSTALLLVLDALTPEQRVAFVLHDVLGVGAAAEHPVRHAEQMPAVRAEPVVHAPIQAHRSRVFLTRAICTLHTI